MAAISFSYGLYIARIDEAEGAQPSLAYHYDSSREMQKLLDELDHKHLETRDKKIKEEPVRRIGRRD